MRLAWRVPVHFGGRACGTLVLFVLAWSAGLALLLGSALVLREPLALHLALGELLGRGALEALAWAALLAPPWALVWSLSRLRDEGSLAAAHALPRAPWLWRCALLVPGLAAIALGARLVHESLPAERLQLQTELRSLPLERLGPRELAGLVPELAGRLGPFALRFEGFAPLPEAGGVTLERVRALQLQGEGRVLTLRAARAHVRALPHGIALRCEHGVLQREGSPVAFDALELSLARPAGGGLDVTPVDVVGSAGLARLGPRLLARAARSDPDAARIAARAARYAREPARRQGRVLGALFALALVLLVHGRLAAPGRAAQATCWLAPLALPLLLPPLLALPAERAPEFGRALLFCAQLAAGAAVLAGVFGRAR